MLLISVKIIIITNPNAMPMKYLSVIKVSTPIQIIINTPLLDMPHYQLLLKAPPPSEPGIKKFSKKTTA